MSRHHLICFYQIPAQLDLTYGRQVAILENKTFASSWQHYLN
jgi:hypothetical protein